MSELAAVINPRQDLLSAKAEGRPEAEVLVEQLRDAASYQINSGMKRLLERAAKYIEADREGDTERKET